MPKAQIVLKPFTRSNVRVLDSNTILLMIGTAKEDDAFTLKPDQRNPLIELLIKASLNPKLTESRPPAVASPGGLEKVLTFQLEKIAASHSPANGTVAIVITLTSGFRAALEMSAQESLALIQELQAAAGRAEAPRSTAKH